jgi:hypothetical protein
MEHGATAPAWRYVAEPECPRTQPGQSQERAVPRVPRLARSRDSNASTTDQDHAISPHAPLFGVTIACYLQPAEGCGINGIDRRGCAWRRYPHPSARNADFLAKDRIRPSPRCLPRLADEHRSSIIRGAIIAVATPRLQIEREPAGTARFPPAIPRYSACRQQHRPANWQIRALSPSNTISKSSPS